MLASADNPTLLLAKFARESTALTESMLSTSAPASATANQQRYGDANQSIENHVKHTSHNEHTPTKHEHTPYMHP